MTGSPKFAILEKDGVEYGGLGPREYEPDSTDVYYDAGKTETVKDKIDIAAKGYGTFFQNKLDQDLIIPAGRSMVVMDYIDLDGYELCIDGGLEISL